MGLCFIVNYIRQKPESKKKIKIAVTFGGVGELSSTPVSGGVAEVYPPMVAPEATEGRGGIGKKNSIVSGTPPFGRPLLDQGRELMQGLTCISTFLHFFLYFHCKLHYTFSGDKISLNVRFNNVHRNIYLIDQHVSRATYRLQTVRTKGRKTWACFIPKGLGQGEGFF